MKSFDERKRDRERVITMDPLDNEVPEDLDIPADTLLKPNEAAENALDKLMEEMQGAIESVRPRYDLPAAVGEYQAVKAWPFYFVRPMKARQEIQLMALLGAKEDRSASESVEMTMSTASLLLYKADLPDDPTEARDRILAHVRGDVNIFKPVSADEILDKWTLSDVVENVLSPMGFWNQAEGEVPNE